LTVKLVRALKGPGPLENDVTVCSKFFSKCKFDKRKTTADFTSQH